MLDFQPNQPPTYEEFVTACYEGNLPFVELALESQEIKSLCEVDCNNSGLTGAAIFGHLSIVNRLLKIEAVRKNLTALNIALGFAAERGHLPVVNQLLEIDSLKSAIESSVLRRAVRNERFEVVIRLLQEKPVSDHLKQKEQDFIKRYQDFFKEIESRRLSKVLASKFLFETVPPYIDTHILSYAFHDELCGKSECMKIKEGNQEGIVSCPIINQFKNKALSYKATHQKAVAAPAVGETTQISSCSYR